MTKATNRTSTQRQQMARLTKQIAALEGMGIRDLQEMYSRTVGKPTRSNNAAYLRTQTARALQEQACPKQRLSIRARKKIAELNQLDGTPLDRPVSSKETPKKGQDPRDPRLPPAGSELTRTYKGEEHRVIVGEGDFVYRGKSFVSLSAVAKAITGSRWNGFLFFRLRARQKGQHKP